MNQKQSLIAMFSPLLLAVQLLGQGEAKATCSQAPPAACNEEACCRTYCLGPVNQAVNPPVNPVTCNGDWVLSVSGFYWNFHQDAMEFAIVNEVTLDDWLADDLFVGARYVMPKTSWDPGFKLGIGYHTTCDGWDFGATWTRFHGHSSTHVGVQEDDNAILLSLWSYLGQQGGGVETFIDVTDINASWKLKLDLIDIELGRNSWNSRRLSLRPFIGLRIASTSQEFTLFQRGGFLQRDADFNDNDTISLNNKFDGVGFRGGLDTVWNLGCGWGIYTDGALSLVYGRFKLDQSETLREVESPFAKTKILETEKHYRAVRLQSDLELGLQWQSLFCDCAYGLTVSLGWEIHTFMDANPINRITCDSDTRMLQQLRSDLDTQGWTLSVDLAF